MAQFVTSAQLSGFYKEIYGDSVENLIPDSVKILKRVPFREAQKIGNQYHQPVSLTYEHGFTYGSYSDGAFALNNSISMVMQDAQVSGSVAVLRSAISYEAASRASGSKQAFAQVMDPVMKSMLDSMGKRLELSILYGGDGIGEADSSVNASATSTVVTLTAASWATGIWAGLENAEIQFHTTAADTLVSSGADSVFVISSVDVDNLALTVTGTATGISALDTSLASENSNIRFNGSFGKEMSGLSTILQNTGSLFNISASTYHLWKGNNVSETGQLSMSKIVKAIAKAAAKGLNEDVVAFVNPDTWKDLHADQAAIRVFDQSFSRSRGEEGSEEIVYYSQNGKIEVVSHNLIKAGECYVLPLSRLIRIGSMDISFRNPARKSEDIFFELPSNAGFELRGMYDQAILLERPAYGIRISGFTNGS